MKRFGMIKMAFFVAAGTVALLGFNETAMAHSQKSQQKGMNPCAASSSMNPCASSSKKMKPKHEKTKGMNPCAATSKSMNPCAPSSSKSMKSNQNKAKGMNPCAAQ